VRKLRVNARSGVSGAPGARSFTRACATTESVAAVEFFPARGFLDPGAGC
jgi:hypothetical protein